MREIKFRVWCEDKKEMLDVQGHSFKTGKSMPYGWNMQYEFDAIMQYTGIKDKNGQDMYEGDIIGLSNGTPYKYVVVFAFGCFMARNKDGICRNLFEIVEPEVIGNIYENRELLEE